MVAHRTKKTDSPVDLDDSGSVIFHCACHDMVHGSAQVVITEGTGAAYVLTVVVSNDETPCTQSFENHPSAITLTNSAKISAAFSVIGYRWFGLKLTTVASGNTLAHLILMAKDSPI